MALDDDKKKKIIVVESEEEGGESSGTSGQSGSQGQIEFRDFLASQPQRDDLLTSDEKKRLLIVHQSTHEAQVKKQKATREERRALKNGKISLQSYYQRMQTNAGSSKYKINPALANKAQFSGIDRQVNTLPNEQIAETNQDKREKLEYQYNLRHRPQATAKFVPPKLTPNR